VREAALLGHRVCVGDGAAIGTQWSCSNGDSASLIGKLTVLTHDLMAARE
jgi:hypothetical protein